MLAHSLSNLIISWTSPLVPEGVRVEGNLGIPALEAHRAVACGTGCGGHEHKSAEPNPSASHRFLPFVLG